MAALTLSFLGSCQVTHVDQSNITFRGRKAQALLTYLAVERQQPHNRESLVGLFWPELNEQDARNNLRVTLSRLRQQLEPKESTSPAYFINNRHTIQFNPESDYHLDVATFQAHLAFRQSHAHPPTELCPECVTLLTEAGNLYQGPLLANFHLDDCLAFDEWLLLRREHFHLQALDLFDQLTQFYLATGSFEQAIKYARRQIALEPLQEAAHRQLMKALWFQGQRTVALSQFQACETILKTELNIAPDQETWVLYEQIRAETLATPITEPQQPPQLSRAKPDQYISLARLEPRPDQKLFGVETALKTIGQMLTPAQRPWLICIDGIGGLGKTSLAHQLAQIQVESNQFFDIGWVSAKQTEFLPTVGLQETGRPALSVEILIDTLLHQLDNQPHLPATITEKEIALTRLLKENAYFVVIDNLETVIDYETLLPTLRRLVGPSKFLLTSRLSLQNYADVYCYSLNELSLEDSLTLLRYEAQNRGLRHLEKATSDQLTLIYQVAGGNPLALKLIVGQLGFIPLGQVLHNLKEAEGKQVIEFYAYIYWQAWQMLDTASRQLLLSLPFSPNCTLSELVELGPLSIDKLQDALFTLIRLSLVEVGGNLETPRYRLHRLTETFLLHEVVKWQASS